MTQRRVSIFVDGANFNYLVLRKLPIACFNFDLNAFVNSLIDGEQTIVHKRYYIGLAGEKYAHLVHASVEEQGAYLTQLDQQGFVIYSTPLRHRLTRIKIDERVRDYENLRSMGVHAIKHEQLREKGVDVKIAIDLLIGAYKNDYDEAYLISSDTDLTPAINVVRKEFGKKIIYVGFSIQDTGGHDHTTPTRALMYSCDRYIICNAPRVEQYKTAPTP